MTDETALVKLQIESTGRAEILLEEDDYLIVKWTLPTDGGARITYSFEAFAYSASGMGNNYPWSHEVSEERARYFAEHADEATEYFKSKHHYFHTEIREVGYDEIRGVDGSGITFGDGHVVTYHECAVNFKRKHPESGGRCIGERDMTAEPPYIEIYGVYAHDRIIFDRKGGFAERENLANFHKLRKQIEEFGYTTFDLS
ncbi:MAG: hypothetical protein NC299_07925 [Lachnospiraceae bacterium]|nr:hypothetical protein [Ruminococcus sp.]MCM1275279.1 hypothetical protein [Lachnospiraceae bacterium]